MSDPFSCLTENKPMYVSLLSHMLLLPSSVQSSVSPVHCTSLIRFLSVDTGVGGECRQGGCFVHFLYSLTSRYTSFWSMPNVCLSASIRPEEQRSPGLPAPALLFFVLYSLKVILQPVSQISEIAKNTRPDLNPAGN